MTENRLAHKASKRDIEASNARLLHDAQHYRLVSREGEIPSDNYVRVDNTHLTPDEAAEIIRQRFRL